MTVRRLLRWPVRFALLAGAAAGLRRLLATRRSGELRPSNEPWTPLTTPPAADPGSPASPLTASDATAGETPGPEERTGVGAAVGTLARPEPDLADAAAAEGPIEDAAVPAGTETARVVGEPPPERPAVPEGPASGEEGPASASGPAPGDGPGPATAATAPGTATTGGTVTATATEAAWVQPVDATCPTSHPVKANESSGIYHLPGGLSYDRVVPERCYRTPAEAESDGFRAAKR
jgi:hypothetical protein